MPGLVTHTFQDANNTQSWLGRPRFALDGVIYRYDTSDESAASWTKLKQVPSDKVVVTLEGNWMKVIRYRMKGEKVRRR